MKIIEDLSYEEMQECEGGRPNAKMSFAYDATYLALTILYYAAQGLRMVKG